MRKKPPPDHSLLRRPPKAEGFPFFLWNTRPDDTAKQWTAHRTKAAALREAQTIIDKAGASAWLWIEDGEEIHVSPDGEKNAEWRLTLFESLFDALDAIADLPPEEHARHHAVILAVEAGKEIEPRALPRTRRAPKRKPVKS